ncbi:MAG: hypothetical protein A3K19_07850 [Lentisphaerae bacterium RIFOXYB12_FULL_65_16]|nr:MAG: hypothetical protein A3K18_31725 [Lentisphaerae bacterium RIFOXYA12_64_32]OGV87564.1 MAG: hypothetical protein A3K19_07850 [Lentisphaerae bacterium RIFOXYB12_FULL_65_16]
MKSKKPQLDPESQEKALAELRRYREERETGYRSRALKLFPHVCASCGREIPLKRLHELTVHHRDHNWKNNPPDGSNWELLCIYCHDYEHERHEKVPGADAVLAANKEPEAPPIANPFANLDALLKTKDEKKG